MKTAALAFLALVLSASAFATEANIVKPVDKAKLLYMALNVEPQSNTSFEVWWNQKSVGGLVCTETHAPYPTAPATYSCDVDASHQQDNEAIYDALNVPAIALHPRLLGVGAYKKVVGDLTCTLRHIVYPQAPMTYSCTLQ